MRGIITAIIGLVVGVYMFASIVPGAIAQLMDSGNWTGVTGAPLTLGTVVLPIVIIAGSILLFLKSSIQGD